jgi:hypothetical protein
VDGWYHHAMIWFRRHLPESEKVATCPIEAFMQPPDSGELPYSNGRSLSINKLAVPSKTSDGSLKMSVLARLFGAVKRRGREGDFLKRGGFNKSFASQG